MGLELTVKNGYEHRINDPSKHMVGGLGVDFLENILNNSTNISSSSKFKFHQYLRNIQNLCEFKD
jgi:hypothetical protein